MRRQAEIAFVALAAAFIVLSFAALLEHRPGPPLRVIGFVLTFLACPWFLLIYDTFGVHGYWSKLATLWAGLSINAFFVIGFLRWLRELRRLRRANLGLG